MQLPALVSSFSLLGAALAVSEHTQPLEDRAATATVVLDTATVIGNVMNNVESFGGIPYAKPPTGSLRLKPPVRLTDNIGTFDATGPAGACPQMVASSASTNALIDILGDIANLPFIQTATGQSEDCLTITVARPQGTTADAKLPVLYWIFGGGFELGWSSMYDGTGLVQHGVDISKPFVFVAVNYRVAGFGFLPGKEILADGSANLGLLDQRMGLEWVADNIAAFGGDPDKVTIWGESAGAISVFDQMALYGGDNKYKGKPLFRGAIMNSGSITPTDPVDCPKGQAIYDTVVKNAGCAGKADTLACLREVDYTTFLNAATSVPGILSYNSLALSYLPRPDGTALPASPDVLAKEGRYAAVPMIIGDQEDEGTLFGLFQANLTTTDKFVQYLKDYYFATATTDQIKAYVATYDTGINAIINGSPHRTGLLNEIFPGFKLRAAVLGDLVFTLTRRVFLQLAAVVNPSVPAWSYLASYDYGTPILGTFHGSDLLQVFYGVKDNYAARSIRTYYTNFVYALDPNVGLNGAYPTWAQWGQGQNLMQFFANSASTLKDDFRKSSSDWILNNAGSFYEYQKDNVGTILMMLGYFCKDLLTNPSTRNVTDISHTIAAVSSSNDPSKAAAFLSRIAHPDPSRVNTYGSYQALVDDPAVDIVYIATPHSHHFQNAMLALIAGKHVLCEKALCVTAAQARCLVRTAKDRKLFFMEGVWTRFFPLSRRICELVSGGEIGTVYRVTADLSRANGAGDDVTGKRLNYEDGHRMVNPDLAGGVLLGLGVYALTWVFQILYHLQPEAEKEAPEVKAVVQKYHTGIDESVAMLLNFPRHGTVGIATTSLRVATDPGEMGNPAVRIQGSKGEIQVAHPAYNPASFKIIKRGDGGESLEEVVECPQPQDGERGWGNGTFWEADESARCIRDGRLESGIMPWAESVLVMETMDEVLCGAGIVYPDVIISHEFDLCSPLNIGG